jgi:hypothetical protein
MRASRDYVVGTGVAGWLLDNPNTRRARVAKEWHGEGIETRMIYISYGVPKSASTYTYIVTETVLKTAGHSPIALSTATKGRKSPLNYISPVTSADIDQVRSEIGIKSAVIKTHGAPGPGLIKAIEQGQIFASAVVRDPRDIALSLMDHGAKSRAAGKKDFAEIETTADAIRLLDDQFRRLNAWAKCSKLLVLRYDEVCFDTPTAIKKILDQLGLRTSVERVLAALPDRTLVKQFNHGERDRYKLEMAADTQTIFLRRYKYVYKRYLVARDPALQAGGYQ